MNGGEVVHDQTMWRKHFHRLRSLYEHHAPRPTRMLDHRNLMLTRIFSMALRYDCLSKTKSAYQAALPHKLMQRLSTKLGVNHECFASPLNHYFPSYCSVFHDTDRTLDQAPSTATRPLRVCTNATHRLTMPQFKRPSFVSAHCLPRPTWSDRARRRDRSRLSLSSRAWTSTLS